MAAKLCCTAESDSRTSSPQLPNALITETAPVKLPLLVDQAPSQSSNFTSAQTGDLCEIRNIFQNASDTHANPPSPTKAGRARFIKPSVYSLHSLHKIKSVHSMIKRKFSKDLVKKPSSEHARTGGGARNVAGPTPDVALAQSNGPPNLQLKLTKFDLKQNLLSNKEPHEGGYDPDAEVLDDIGKNVGKRALKRRSIHSIEWSPSTASKPTPGSSSKSRHSQPALQVEPYQIERPAKPLSTPLSKVFSTPDLQINASKGHDRKLRRSHSVTSIELPAPSPLSPLRLPSLKGSEIEGVAWSKALNESLRLSHNPVQPGRISTGQSKASSTVPVGMKNDESSPSKLRTRDIPTPEIRVQEPTTTATPRPSTSIRSNTLIKPKDKPQSSKTEGEEDDLHDDPRQSIHLYSMRISHHLRSGSLVSSDNPRDPSELSASIRQPFRDRSNSDLSQISRKQTQISRHERQTSSSGFASSNVPSKWGRVVSGEIREDKSSIYSSRPQSPPDGCGDPLANVTQTSTARDLPQNASPPITRLRRSNSSATDMGSRRDAVLQPLTIDPLSLAGSLVFGSELPNDRERLARSNSSSSTKKSKFREEFSPSPPKRRIAGSVSIMKLLHPRRRSFRSQSEAIVRPSLEPVVDGSLEVPLPATQRERRLSRSEISFEKEQGSLGKDKKFSPMWEKALTNHQQERSAFFLSPDKNLAVRSPFRERSASIARPRPSLDSTASPGKADSMKRHSAPLLGPPTSDQSTSQDPEGLHSRRTAFVGTDATDMSSSDEIRRRFDQQTDTADIVGAWGRYPSHSRAERTSSAGHLDAVQTRDFALEAAIKFATGANVESDEEEIDPNERPATPPLLPGEKKRRKKIGNTRMAKSHSMTFGKSFLRNYTRLFRSQSIEFQKYGRGHRTSISSGGTLEYPELEILPDIWRRDVIEEASGEQSHSSTEEHGNNEAHLEASKDKGKAKAEDSRSTLRPPNSSAWQHDGAMTGLDGQSDLPPVMDNARILSAYYENCLPNYPRASLELDSGLEDFGVPARRSLDSKGLSMHTRTLPDRLSKHARNPSRVSRFSVVSAASLRPSFVSSGENDNATDQVSVASVRRSTMDLINMYKEQEITEREKVLNLMRVESIKENRLLAGL